MSGSTYGPFWTDVVSDYLGGHTVKAMLVTPDYVFDKDHQFRSQVTDEVEGTDYDEGGIALTGISVVWQPDAERVMIDANDANFGAIAVGNIGGLVVYVAFGSAGTDRIMSYHSFEPQYPVGPFKYSWSADGVGYLPV